MKFDILESLNYKANITWKSNPDNQVGYFSIEDENYTIIIHFGSLALPQRKSPLEIFEISFQRLIEGQPTVRQTDSKYPSKVFGAVFNASLDVIKKDNPDVIVFSAKYENDSGNQEIFNKRVRIYSGIAHKIAQFGTYNQNSHEPLKSSYALNFILVHSNIQISNEEIEYIKGQL